MEGSENGPDGVQSSGTRISGCRNALFARASNFPQNSPEGSCSPPITVFKEDEMDGSGDVSARSGDGNETNEVGGAKWRNSRISRASGSTSQNIPEGRAPSPVRVGNSEVVEEESRIGTKGAGNGVVSEVQNHGWQSTRVRRPPRSGRVRVDSSNRRLRGTPAVSQRIERTELAAFADLFGSQSRGAEAGGSGSRDFPTSSSVLGVSSDEETAIVLGKEPSQEIIDLVSDSPTYGSARIEGMSLFHREGPNSGRGEAGPSQNSVVSPLRRPLQRSAAQSAKRPRGVLYRSDRGSSQRPIDLGGGPLVLNGNANQESILEPIDRRNTVFPLLEHYNLRRSGSINMAASSNSSGLDGDLSSNLTGRGVGRRSGRHRFQQLGSSPGAGFSEFGSDLRRPTVATDGGDESGDIDLNRPMELENLESPPVSSHIPRINLDDDAETDRAQQVAEDERLARVLQDRYASEERQGEQAPSDEMIARMLQDEENARSRGLPLGQRSMLLGPIQAFLGEMENQREARRLLRNELPQNQAEQSVNPGSSSRGVRRPRSSAFTRMLNPQSAANMDERRVQFPAAMALESRLEFLAALEMAFQERLPVGLQLAHVDRDFNENDYEMLLALDTDNDGHRGASQESLSQLPLTVVAPTDVCEEDCSICLEVPVAGDVVRRLPCMHVFHQQCIDKWLQCQAVCPVCKAHI